MFVKPTKPMIAIAARKRAAWHPMTYRQGFQTS
jgi:hypothetical protein